MNSDVSVFFVILILSYMSFIWKKRGSLKGWRPRLDVFARILKSSIEESFLYSTVQGRYQGREVILRFHKITDLGPELLDIMTVVRVLPRQLNYLMMTYPKPTRNTFLKGANIYFAFPPFWRRDKYKGIWDDSKEMIKLFDELCEAAEIVEADRPYFKREVLPGHPENTARSTKILTAQDYQEIEKREVKEKIIMVFIGAVVLVVLIVGFAVFFMPQ